MTLDTLMKAMRLYGITDPAEVTRLYALARDIHATIQGQPETTR